MTKSQEKTGKDEREDRLQQALRANLRRRKGQDHIPTDKKKANS